MATDTVTADDFSAIKKDLANLRKEIEKLGGDIRNTTESRLSELGGKLAGMARDKADAVKHGFYAVRDQTEKGATYAKEFTEEHPFTTALSALGIGLIAGLLLGRRK